MKSSFAESFLDKIATETGFCKCKRKLTPKIFLEMLLSKTFNGEQQSLLDHSRELAINSGIEVNKQSIDARFTPEALTFIKKLVSHQMENWLDQPLAIIEVFSFKMRLGLSYLKALIPEFD